MTENSLQNVIKGAEKASNSAGAESLPPVDDWNPPYCGDIGMRITRDGTWFYGDSAIGREKLVRLFSTILRRDEDECYYLVTPVEKILVTVEDAPFIATQMDVTGDGETQKITFITNVGDVCAAGQDLPIYFEFEGEQPSPYVHVRGRLRAKIARPVFYRLVDLAVTHQQDGVDYLGVWSDGVFFSLSRVDKLGPDYG
ncbi:hypothetical protein IMCC14465_14110 [alpha proteobacterium IMCC14465]|uniref:Proteophosphoglycan n=1 Tax=alpha proteobacterium IMCC14465 TaxID=1220535 RepID=J9A5I4_9PROT|nr:hypothetical protein IMCC14465_14110 [alpha proteobacterium IMCC14465]